MTDDLVAILQAIVLDGDSNGVSATHCTTIFTRNAIEKAAARIVELEAQVKAAHVAGFNDGINQAVAFIAMHSIQYSGDEVKTVRRIDGDKSGYGYATGIANLGTNSISEERPHHETI